VSALVRRSARSRLLVPGEADARASTLPSARYWAVWRSDLLIAFKTSPCLAKSSALVTATSLGFDKQLKCGQGFNSVGSPWSVVNSLSEVYATRNP